MPPLIFLMLFINIDALGQKKVYENGKLKNVLPTLPDSVLVKMQKFSSDSSFKTRFDPLFQNEYYLDKKNLSLKRMPLLEKKDRELIQINGGFINYNWDYNNVKDSVYAIRELSQHLITVGMNVVLAGKLPLKVTYYDRESNSPFFKSYHNFRIDLDIPKSNELRKMSSERKFEKIAESIRKRGLPETINEVDQYRNLYEGWINDPKVLSNLIHCKEQLLSNELDSESIKAKQFISLYEDIQSREQVANRISDSLKHEFAKTEYEIKELRQFVNQNKKLDQDQLNALSDKYGIQVKKLNSLTNTIEGIRTFSVGYTLPNYSNLSVQNLNVNGFNWEYNKKNLYGAATAGLIDYKLQNLIHAQPLAKQYLYAARIGYGKIQNNNIILTYYDGQKQINGSYLQAPITRLNGITLAAQLYFREIKVTGELAESLVKDSTFNHSTSLKFNDPSKQGYAVGFSSNIKSLGTYLEGYYQHTGIHFQSFNNFQYPSNTDRWSIKIEQSIWEKQILIATALHKNNFSDPTILQHYNANSVYKSISIALKRMGWPNMIAGYIPVSQYSLVNNLLFENHYQAFNASINYPYYIGPVKAVSTLLYNKIFSQNNDSVAGNFNSMNAFYNQEFIFNYYETHLGITATSSNQYRLYQMEGGISSLLFNKWKAGIAIKIYNLNNMFIKTGFSSIAGIDIRKFGVFQLRAEENYLPDNKNGLSRYELYSISFTRYFYKSL